MKTTPAKMAVECGVTTLQSAADYLKESRRNLVRLFDSEPAHFECLILGVAFKMKKVDSGEGSFFANLAAATGYLDATTVEEKFRHRKPLYYECMFIGAAFKVWRGDEIRQSYFLIDK